ncbi:rhodanese-like domain-containing protein [Salidesulfovibrio onnuriiensis]|uniref:rhodanese-like domain-containing protein n=1 Tax=Salidesulfovibrio onnuriiensis TaxID=2583823 RepID=UPI001C9BCF0A|nr:rhodanese-like domain-containing protein [Salidesulfovibrio onnuriiensis]
MKRNFLFALVAVVALSFLGGCLGSGKFKDEVEKEKSAVKLVREMQRGDYDIIDTAGLKALMDKGTDMLVVDTMPYEASFKKNHVPGAVAFEFPIPDMNEWDNAQTAGKSQEEFIELLGPDKDKLLVFYCGFVKCTRSHNGAVWAKKLGYTNVVRYPGGIFAWKGADYPVASEE